MSSAKSYGFICPDCGKDKTYVSDSRGNKDASKRRRRRFCEVCGHRFSTVEITDAEYRALIGNASLAELKRELTALIDRKMLRIVLRPQEQRLQQEAQP